jgi:hypothetical protein
MFKYVAVIFLVAILMLIANSLNIIDTAKTLIYLMIGMFGLVGFWYASME